MISFVVTGEVRSPLETWMVLGAIVDAKSASPLINRIIFVTWESARDSDDRLREYFKHSGVEFIYLPKKERSSFSAQMRCFIEGLRQFDGNEEIVARLRTDKCYPLTKKVLANIDRIGSMVARAEKSVFDGRFIVPAVSINEPFAHQDFALIAKIRDWKRVCHLDTYLDEICPSMMTEERWFIRPYMIEYDVIRRVIEAVSPNDIRDALWNCCNVEDGAFQRSCFPLGLSKFLGAYWSICAADFVTLDVDSDELGSRSLLDLLRGDGADDRWGRRVFVNKPKAINDLISEDSQLKFRQTVGRLEVFTHQNMLEMTISTSELSEVKNFVRFWKDRSSEQLSGKIRLSRPIEALFDDVVSSLGLDEITERALLGVLSPVLSDFLAALESVPDNLKMPFHVICRDFGKRSEEKIRTEYDDALASKLKVCSAIFYLSALVYEWDGESAIWLIKSLLFDGLPETFASRTRWGVLARIYDQPADVKYWAGEMLIRGLGGPVEAEWGHNLQKLASNEGYVVVP